MKIFGASFLRDDARRLTGRAEQAIGAELVTLGDGSERGVRCVRLRSGEIEVEVIVDRALDLGRASVRGVPVAWLSPTGIAGPWFADPHGFGPFRTFVGGLLTTCGLEHTLGPDEDDATPFGYPGQATHAFPLHGRLSVTPARLTGYGIDWDAGAIFCRGDVRQANVFGEVLVLERQIRIGIGSGVVQVADTVRNEGFAPTPQMVLYHVNAGWPLVGPGARVAAAVGEPRVATPAAADQDWRAVDGPARGAVEQVWEHTPIADADGLGRAAVINDDIGDGRAVALEMAFGLETLPRLFQWRVMSEGNYVIGLEPGNLRIEGRKAAREAGDLVVLEPGEERAYDLRLTLHSDAGAIAGLGERLGSA